jgi:flagellar protein FliO/FliZ
MNPSLGGMLWFSFFWLALAAGLIWVVAYIVKRDAATKASNPNVKILAQQAIGPRERILVVNVLGRILVLGHSPNQINFLMELAPEDLANLTQQNNSLDFSMNLKRFVKRKMS